jgi:hypothetical protein
MTIAEAIKQAVNETDRSRRAVLLRDVMNDMRFRLRLNYQKSQEMFAKCGIDAGQFEELCMEVDNDN